MRKAYLIHGIPSKEKTCMSLEFQKIRRRGWKAYLKTRWVRTSQSEQRFWYPRTWNSGVTKQHQLREILSNAHKNLKNKDKEKIFRVPGEKKACKLQGDSNKAKSADFTAECLQARRKEDDILKVLKGKNSQPRILCLAKLYLRNEGEIKTFLDKQKLREFITSRSASQELLKGVLQAEMKEH